MGLAESVEQLREAGADAVISMTPSDGGIAIHCRGSSGRTGFMAALILREIGMDSSRADAQTNYLRARDDQYSLLEQ